MNEFFYLIATDQNNGIGASIIKPILQILSYPYRLIPTLKRSLYEVGMLKKQHLNVPVISIGNITVGGTGKTPFVMYLIEMLQKKNKDATVLTRGYMDNSTGSKAEKSDEAVMLKKSYEYLPVLVGANRYENAQNFLSNNRPDVFLLDDGFQHQKLSRDIDIVLIDTTNPWGNGYLMPRGILRESKNALNAVPVFVLTRVDLGRENVREIYDELLSRNPHALIAESIHKPVSYSDIRSGDSLNLDTIGNKQVCAVCSIGNPNNFFQTLTNLDVDISLQLPYMDHHVYERQDIENIDRLCREQRITTIITTEKDAVKFEKFLNVFSYETRILTLNIRIMITEEEEEFLERIDRIL